MITAPNPLLSSKSARDPFLIPAVRDGSRDLHARIERHIDLENRIVSLGAYQAMLERYYGLYTPLEEMLSGPEWAAGWAALGIDFESRRKARLLESDLRALGLTSVQLSHLERADWRRSPAPAAPAELAGCAYVVEGATLGGRIIGRHVEQILGLAPGAPGARFFFGYGTQTGAMWLQFQRGAEEFAAREEEQNCGAKALIARQAVAAARRTFTEIETFLTEMQPRPASKTEAAQ